MPQLDYYLKKCNEHIEFTVKLKTASVESVMAHVYGGLFGGVSSSQENSNVNSDGKEVIDGYKVADAEDIEWLASIL